MTGQLDGNTNGDSLLLVHLIEVDMQQGIRFTKLGSGDCKSNGLGETVLTLLLTIKITGNESLLAQLLGCLLACRGTLLATYTEFFHNLCYSKLRI